MTTPLEVLLVEDNVLNRELVTDLLDASGHTVHVAKNAAEFRALLREPVAPDVILMDIRLPDASGLDLLREILASPLREVPVAAITAHALSGDADRLRTAGFVTVITKPIDTRSLVACVEALAAAKKSPVEPTP